MFIRKDTPTVMSGLVVRYQLESDIYSGEINASRDGVSLCGRWPIMSADESVMVEETLARAIAGAAAWQRRARGTPSRAERGGD